MSPADTRVEDLVARSRQLGADPRTTNHAGGNTSAKGTAVDPVTGADVELLWVKGSGGDLGTPTEEGPAVLRPDRLRALVGAYPGADREDEMVAALDYCLHGRGGAAPSIDTAMHGLVAAAHVDHLHPDAGCPDHFLRTKVRPLLVDLPADADVPDAVARLTELHAAYREDYAAYYDRHATPDSPPMRGADPAVVLVPGVGMFTFGRDAQIARVAGEFYLNAIAERLGAEGAAVVVADLDGEKAAKVAASLGGPDVAVAVHADVTSEHDVRAMVDAAAVAFGGVDLVVSNSAAKADQAHQVRLLAAELGAHRIRVNGINPDGVVRGSGIFAGGWGAKRAAVYGVPEEELGELYAQRTLLKQEVLPEHVVAAVVALTGPDLRQTTGLHVPVDSGVATAFLR